MQTSIKLSLHTRRIRKDGSYPIIIRLGHFQKTTSISTGHSVPLNYWDDSKQRIRNTYKQVKSINFLNNLLAKQMSGAKDVVNRLQDCEELDFMSIKQVKDKIVNKSKYESFFEFAIELAEDLRLSERLGTARTYREVVSVLKSSINSADVKFNEINYDFLKGFERFHLSKPGNSLNGLAAYMRTIRSIYNQGIKRGFISKDAYPFKDYQIRTEPTAKRAMNSENLKKILALQLEKGSWPFHYRNYFLLSYMLFGMSFIDMAFLKMSNIVDGRVKFQRKKTSKLYDIKITPQMKQMLDFYFLGKKKDDFILPIIKRETLDLQYKDVHGARKRFNKGLRRIAEICQIDEHLTSYVSRHSFATHAMLKQIPLPAISAMLGHSSMATTQVYLKSLPNNIIDSYQEQLNII